MIWHLLGLLTLAPAALAQIMDPALGARLRSAATEEDRINMLPDGAFVFNFLAGVGLTQGSAGTNRQANAGNFPALISNDIAMTIGFLEGCGMNTPHVHPRATEINFAVNGTLRTGFLDENGVRFVSNDVPAGSATVFPRGAIHFEMNTECEPTLFVAAFNDDDPGALAVAQRFFGLPTDIVSAVLGDIGVVQVAGLESKIPDNIAQGTEDCLKRCGIKKVKQPTMQRQPRLSNNALPSGFSGPPVPSGFSGPSTATTSAAAALATASMTSHAQLDTGTSNKFSASDVNPQSLLDDKNIRPFFIALLSINAVFVVGILTALFIYVARRRGSRNGRKDDHSRLLQFPAGADKEHEYYDPYTGPSAAAQ